MSSKTLPQYIAALVAAGGALATGTMLGWTNPVQQDIQGGKLGFSCTEFEYSWVGAIMTLGAAFICIPMGFIVNIIGRKWSLILIVVPFVIGWALLAFAASTIMLYVGRFILGIAGGGCCVCAPMYTGEIAQKEIRGTCGTFFQLQITIGILLVFALGGYLSVQVLTIVCLVIPVIFGIIFFFLPESPTFYITKDKEEAAAKAMEWLRGKDYDAKPEIAELKAIQQDSKDNPVSILTAFKRKATRKGLIIGIMLMFFQQLSGINAVIFYGKDIFLTASPDMDANLSNIIVGVIQIIATGIAAVVVDKLGRRILLIFSALLMALSTAILGVYFFMQSQDEDSVSSIHWLPVFCVCLFIAMFSFGFGPVPWLMMGELFATDIKGFCGSIAGTTNWVFAFVVGKTFVNLKTLLGVGPTFWFFSILTILGGVFVFFYITETKGKSLQEIQEELEK